MVVVKDCENMFWGVTIDTGKRYSQVVKQGFHVSMAALEVSAKKPSENVQIMLQHESSEYLLCTLNSNLLQQPLDLNFASGEQVSFSLNGSGVVHLTGFLIPEEEEPDFEESFSESDEEEIPSLVETPDDGKTSLGSKRKAILSSQTAKKLKLSDSVADDDDDSDDDDYSEEEEGFSDDFDDEFDDDDEEEEDEDDDDLSSEKKDKNKTPSKLSNQETPASQKNKQNLKLAEKVKNANTPKQDGKNSKSPKQNVETPKPVDKAETPSSANEESASKKKKKKKKKKKNKEGDASQNNSTAGTPETTPKTEATPKKRVVAGGTIVEDLKVGNGPEAKPGKMASVYYVGTLAKSGKRFDSCTEGKPFRFRLNQGEVIKGWDNGVLGMKVGGKRRITVPANQGYGNVKQGPIPPNSTLTFEVELKAVS